jgi:hypothetical protein
MPDFGEKLHLLKRYEWDSITFGGLKGYSFGISISMMKVPPS